MINEPKVCVVIVNWNKKDFLTALLETLKRMAYNNHDIIVIDNASTDGSVEAIKKFPEVKLICNPDNTGSSGGFNKGMKFALEKNCYDYIWLLDNDAQIRTDTLSELVKVAENHPAVGAAGSMIVNPDNEDMIVELGGYVSWREGIWKPYMRNQFVPPEGLPSIVVVDYVAACSALLRVDAIKQVGMMDERYFLHWDDVDLCLRIRKAGYKVVAVSSSKIFHEVEKGINPVVVYYDTRNVLLTIAKNLSNIQKIIAFRSILSLRCTGLILSYFVDILNTKLLMDSIADFIKGRFYQLNIRSTTLTEYDELPFNAENIVHYCHKRILILPYGSASQISKVWEHMESLGCNDLYLLIQDTRRNLFLNIPSDRIIAFDDKQTPWEYLKLLIRISAGKYVLAVSPTSLALPFSYTFKSCLCFDSESKQFYESRETRKNFWKLLVSFLAGELIALALLPVFYVKSKKYFLKQK